MELYGLKTWNKKSAHGALELDDMSSIDVGTV